MRGTVATALVCVKDKGLVMPSYSTPFYAERKGPKDWCAVEICTVGKMIVLEMADD